MTFDEFAQAYGLNKGENHYVGTIALETFSHDDLASEMIMNKD